MMTDPVRRSLTRSEYLRLTEMGMFSHARVELLDGQIWEINPLSPDEATALRLTALALRSAFGSGFLVSMRMPITLTDRSEPEPGVSVAPGTPHDYMEKHPGPSEVLLVAEVCADSTLTKNKGPKLVSYAQALIPEYWLLNLADRQLEVYRQPTPAGIYADFRVYRLADSVSPLSAPNQPVAVADLLPPEPKQEP